MGDGFATIDMGLPPDPFNWWQTEQTTAFNNEHISNTNYERKVTTLDRRPHNMIYLSNQTITGSKQY